MAIITVLYDFEDHFMNGDYKRCVHLLTKYIDSTNKVGIICITNQKCLKRLSDDGLSKCHSFLYRMIQQNIIVSELMIHLTFIRKVDINSEVLRKNFILQIMEIHSLPATKEHLCLEFTMLYNCLIISLINDNSSIHLWSDGIWKLINRSFGRAQEVSKPSQRKNHLLYCLSHNVSFLKNIVLTNMSRLDKHILYYLCFAIGWLAALQDDDLVVSAIIKAMTNLKKLNNSQQLNEMRNFQLKLFCSIEISPVSMFLTSDVHDLLIVCLAIKQNNFTSAVHYLNKLSVPEWKYIISYIKAFIYYKRNQLDMTMGCCIKFWDEKANCENQLTARFCNLLGCCYFIQNELGESQKWFQVAIDHDENFFLPVYNLSLVFLYLNKTSVVTKILKSLAERLHHVTLYSCFVFQHFMLQYQPELMNIEADYYLAHHYVNLGHYSDAALIFAKLLLFLQQNKTQIFSTYSCERIPYFFCLLHVEGAYTFLRSNAYDKCIQTCDSLQRIIPISQSENILLSDWIMDIIPSLVNEKSILTQHNCPVVLSENEEDNLAIKRMEDLKAVGNYFHNKAVRSLMSEEEKILENKFLCFTAQFIKALAVYKTSNVQEAINVMSRVCDLGLDLLQDKTIISKDKRLGQLSACTLEDHVSNAGSSTDELPPRKNDDTFNFEASEMLTAISENMPLDDDNEKFQVYRNNEKYSDQKSYNLDKIIFISQVYNNMAVFCIADDQLNKAKYYLKIATECMPDNIDVLYNCCLLELKNGNFTVAQNLWQCRKQKTSVIENILTRNISIFPYSVSLEQIQTLNSLLSIDNNIYIAFDIDWTD